MSEDYEVRYWTETLGVTKEELEGAVDQVGNGAEAVRVPEKVSTSPAVRIVNLDAATPRPGWQY